MMLLMAALGANGLIVTPAEATTRNWIGQPVGGSWSVAPNWSPSGVPAAGDFVHLNPSTSSNFATFDANSLLMTPVTPGSVSIAPGANATMTLTNGGFHNFTADSFTVGPRGTYTQQSAGFSQVGMTSLSGGVINIAGGIYTIETNFNMSSGALNFSSNSKIINSGAFDFVGGSVLSNGGTFVNNDLLVLESSSNNFNVTVENHGLIGFNATSAHFIGLTNYADLFLPATTSLTTTQNTIRQVSGTFTNFGNVESNLFVGSGTWDHGGGSLNSSTAVTLGANAGDSAMFVQSGGLVATPNVIVGGSLDPSVIGGVGRYNLSGGSLSIGTLIIGTSNAVGGSFTQSGGLTHMTGASGTCSLIINQNASSSGNLTISGGTFEVLRNSSQLAMVFNHGLITQTGGVVRFEEQIEGSGDIVIGGSASMTVGAATASSFQINTGRIRQNAISFSGNGKLVQLRPLSLGAAAASRVHALTFDETGGTVHGTWDVGATQLVIDYAGASPLDSIRRYIRAGYASGNWTGTGLRSAAAASAQPHNTALGYAEASQVFGPGGGIFEGVQADNSTILIKYTYYGDTDLNGVVDFDDYSRTDNGFNNGGATWFAGDFDYNGHVDFDDYSLIDMSFNTQSGTLRRAMSYLDGGDRSDNAMNTPALRMVQQHFDEFGGAYASSFLSAVPEPHSLATCCALIGLTCKRRRPAFSRMTALSSAFDV
jgi:hypothetical protein